MITLMDTFDAMFSVDDYKDFLEANDLSHTINGMTDDEIEDTRDFINWANDERTYEYDEFVHSLKFVKAEYGVEVTGFLGLWDGSHEICPRTFNSLMDAYNACVREADEVIVEYDENDGSYSVKAYHHDGVNIFIIHALNSYVDEYANTIENNYAKMELPD